MQIRVYISERNGSYVAQAKWAKAVPQACASVTLIEAQMVPTETKNKKVYPAHFVGERLYSNRAGVYDQSFIKLTFDKAKQDFYAEDGRKILGCGLLVLTPGGMYAKAPIFAK